MPPTSPPPEPSARRVGVAAASLLAAAVGSLALWARLYRPVLADPTRLVPTGQFHPGFVWGIDHVARMLTGQRPLSVWTDRLGFPEAVHAELVAWAPAVCVAPLAGVLGPVGALNAALALTSVANALSGAWLLRRLSAAAWPACAALGVALAWIPVAIGFHTAGQLEKAQLWCIFLPLALLEPTLSARPGRAAAAGLAGLATLVAASFTAPSLTLVLPFGMLALGLASLLAGPARASVLLRGALVGGLSVLALLPARAYYAAVTELGSAAFRPASHGDALGSPGSASASLDQLFWPPATLSPYHHLPYLGLAWGLGALLLLGLGLGLRGHGHQQLGPRGGLLAGLLVSVAGILVALGPVLLWRGEPLRLGGASLYLPMGWLARWGYPLAASGQYYRAAALASAGLALVAAAGLARLRPLPATVLALALAGAAVQDGFSATRAWWPLPARPIPGAALLLGLVADPAPGAVLVLPLDIDADVAGQVVAGATLHGRAVTTRIRRMDRREIPSLRELDRQVRAALALDPSQAGPALAAMGFHAVLWYEVPHRDPDLDRGVVERALGPAGTLDGVTMWVLPTP